MRRDVLTSWRRSRISGVDPEHVDVPYVETDLDSHFARVAVPILARTAELLVGDRSCLALSDPAGSVVWRWVSEPMLRNTLDDLSVVEGFCFGEEFVGTNGLGTALETGALAVVRGSEHYVQRFHDVTCVAAPVRHPITRRAVGAVNVTCRAADTNGLLAVVVRKLVDEIVAALHDEATARERALLAAFLDAQRRVAGPVAVVGEGLIIANPQAADLGLDRPDLWDEVRATRATRMDLPADITAQVRLVEQTGSAAGAVLTVAEPTGARRVSGSSGSSDPWAAAVARVGRARGAVAVCGEAGTGKRTVLLTAFGTETTVLDAATYAVDGAARWIAALRAALAGPVLVRHVELLDTAAARAVGAVLCGAAVPVGLTVTVESGETAGAAVLRDELTAATVTLPPLRRVPDDVVALAQAELRRERPDLTFAPDALAALRRHHWPGNIAELVRVVRDVAVAVAVGADGAVVGPGLLPEHIRHARALTPLERAELAVISAVLRAHGGNKSTAARELGISRTALYAKIRTYRL